jgi:GNAT superfamily N-acetyltransferase
VIAQATTDDARQDVLDHFLATFNDIEAQAVPMTRYDDLYDPLVIAFRDHATDATLGAALTCRSQIAVGTLAAQRRGRRVPPTFDYTSVLAKHSELDLISVIIPSARNRGIGSEVLNYLERELQSCGRRIWFGHVTSDLNTDRLRTFYTSHGFKVTEYGHLLPPLLGRNWVMPETMPAAFSFYKKIRATPRSADERSISTPRVDQQFDEPMD